MGLLTAYPAILQETLVSNLLLLVGYLCKHKHKK